MIHRDEMIFRVHFQWGRKMMRQNPVLFDSNDVEPNYVIDWLALTFYRYRNECMAWQLG